MTNKTLSRSILRSPNFRLLLLTRLFSMMALQAQAVIVGWQIYSLTRDPFLLGLTGLAEAVPAIACAFFAGHVVDNGRPHKIYFYCLGVLALNTMALVLIGGGFIHLPLIHLLPALYLGIFVSGFARAFIMPSSFSLLAQIVPRRDIPSASAWLGSGFQAAAIVSPAAAGIIYGVYGARGAWLLPALLILVSFCLIYFINPGAVVARPEKREPALQSIRAGWAFILHHPVLLAAMALDMLAVLFGGAIALLPVFADQILHTGAEGLGIMRAAPAAGAIITSLVLAVRPMRRIPITRLLWVVVGFGVCMIGFGLSTVFWLSLLFLTMSGVFDSVSMVIRGTLMQLLTPDHMRGRVSSVNSMFLISSNELGAFWSGSMARLLGLVPAIVAGGTGTLLVTAVTAIKAPAFRKTVINVEEDVASLT